MRKIKFATDSNILMKKNFYRTGYILVLTICAISFLPYIEFDYRFENFYPQGKNLLSSYTEFTKKFEVENDFVLVGLESPHNVFRLSFLQKADSLCNAIRKIPYVKDVISPTRIQIWSMDGIIPYKTRMLHMNDSSLLKSDSLRWKNRYSVFKNFISKDAKSLLMLIKTEENLSKKKSDYVAKALEDSITQYFPQTNYHLTGRIIIQKSYLEELQKEFMRFLFISVVLIFVCIGILYRSLTISAIFGIHFVIILTTLFLFLHLFGKKINILAIMYPPLAFILVTSHAIHYINSYIRNRKNKALIHTSNDYNKIWKDIGYPSSMAGITTSIGFISFVFTQVIPFRDFGIFSAVLSLLSVALTFFLFPLYLSLIRSEFILKDNFILTASEKMFNKLLLFLLQKKKSIYLATIALTVLSVIAATRLRASHTLLEDLSENLKVKKDLEYFEKTFSGIRPLEILVRPKDDSKNDIYHLMLLHVIIKKIYHPGMLISAGGIAEEWTGNELHFGNLNYQHEEIKDHKKILEDILHSSQGKMIYHKKDNTYRFSGKLKDENSTVIHQKHTWLKYFFQQSGLADKYELEITGSAELIDANHSTLIQNSLQGFVIAIITIMIISLLISRRKRFFLIFLFPNFVPVIFLAGIMGCANISLKASTAIIFSIGLGMIVDATFYFITKYIQTKKNIQDAENSLLQSYQLTAPPVMLSTIILLSGFVSLTFSHFYSLKIFGILMSVIVFLGFLCDVILVPLLIHSLDVKNESKV